MPAVILGRRGRPARRALTVPAPLDKDVALPVIARSLFTHFRSRVDSQVRGSFAERLRAASRSEFGRHALVQNREWNYLDGSYFTA